MQSIIVERDSTFRRSFVEWIRKIRGKEVHFVEGIQLYRDGTGRVAPAAVKKLAHTVWCSSMLRDRVQPRLEDSDHQVAAAAIQWWWNCCHSTSLQIGNDAALQVLNGTTIERQMKDIQKVGFQFA